MNFMLGRDVLMVVGITTYLEAEKCNYGRILYVKLGGEKKNTKNPPQKIKTL